MAVIDELKETILWGGRLIVGGAVLFVCSTIMSDHEKISALDTRVTVLEHAKTTECPHGEWPTRFMTNKIEAVLPDNDFKIQFE